MVLIGDVVVWEELVETNKTKIMDCKVKLNKLHYDLPYLEVVRLEVIFSYTKVVVDILMIVNLVERVKRPGASIFIMGDINHNHKKS